METLRKTTRTLCALLAVTIGSLSLSTAAQAAMVGTQAVVAQEQLNVDRAQLLAAFDRTDVQQQLIARGVDLQQAKERVAAMTDDEVKALNGKMGQLPAGGDLDILGVALVVFIVLLVTDITGYTHIFPFVNHPNR